MTFEEFMNLPVGSFVWQEAPTWNYLWYKAEANLTLCDGFEGGSPGKFTDDQLRASNVLAKKYPEFLTFDLPTQAYRIAKNNNWPLKKQIPTGCVCGQ